MVINGKAKKQKVTRKEALAGFPVVEVLFTVPDEDRNCPYCNVSMEVIGKKVVWEELRIIPAKVERVQCVQEVLGCPECKKDGDSVIVGAETPSPPAEIRPRISDHGCLPDIPEICQQHPALPPGGGLETAGSEVPQSDIG